MRVGVVNRSGLRQPLGTYNPVGHDRLQVHPCSFEENGEVSGVFFLLGAVLLLVRTTQILASRQF